MDGIAGGDRDGSPVEVVCGDVDAMPPSAVGGAEATGRHGRTTRIGVRGSRCLLWRLFRSRDRGGSVGLLGHGSMGTPDRQPVLGGGPVGGGRDGGCSVSVVALRGAGGRCRLYAWVHAPVPCLGAYAGCARLRGPELLLTAGYRPQGMGGVAAVPSIIGEFLGLRTLPVCVVGVGPP